MDIAHTNLLVISEEQNALDYLRKSREYIGQVASDRIAWKWATISLDAALYGFAICALKGTNPHRVMKTNKDFSVNIAAIPVELDSKSFQPDFRFVDTPIKKQLKFKGAMSIKTANLLLGLSSDTSYRDAVIDLYEKTHEIISFPVALERCQDPKWMLMTVQSKPLVMSESQKASVTALHEKLRNNFEHYGPRAWMIETSGMPQIVINVMHVIRFLALETGNYIHLKQQEKKEIRSIVFQSKRLLRKLLKGKDQ
jgi:hypothetical protein